MRLVGYLNHQPTVYPDPVGLERQARDAAVFVLRNGVGHVAYEVGAVEANNLVRGWVRRQLMGAYPGLTRLDLNCV
jgi:hypothetical protein